jgi:hypothetical protein
MKSGRNAIETYAANDLDICLSHRQPSFERTEESTPARTPLTACSYRWECEPALANEYQMDPVAARPLATPQETWIWLHPWEISDPEILTRITALMEQCEVHRLGLTLEKEREIETSEQREAIQSRARRELDAVLEVVRSVKTLTKDDRFKLNVVASNDRVYSGGIAEWDPILSIELRDSASRFIASGYYSRQRDGIIWKLLDHDLMEATIGRFLHAINSIIEDGFAVPTRLHEALQAQNIELPGAFESAFIRLMAGDFDHPLVGRPEMQDALLYRMRDPLTALAVNGPTIVMRTYQIEQRRQEAYGVLLAPDGSNVTEVLSAGDARSCIEQGNRWFHPWTSSLEPHKFRRPRQA